jgi:hypothetical protein
MRLPSRSWTTSTSIDLHCLLLYIMEKYRRWTDETAGVNPFVAANSNPPSFLGRVGSFVREITCSLL